MEEKLLEFRKQIVDSIKDLDDSDSYCYHRMKILEEFDEFFNLKVVKE